MGGAALIPAGFSTCSFLETSNKVTSRLRSSVEQQVSVAVAPSQVVSIAHPRSGNDPRGILTFVTPSVLQVIGSNKPAVKQHRGEPSGNDPVGFQNVTWSNPWETDRAAHHTMPPLLGLLEAEHGNDGHFHRLQRYLVPEMHDRPLCPAVT